MKKSELAKTAMKALTLVAPIPGLGLLMDKRVRRNARRAAGFALVGAGALVLVPAALYLICKTAGSSQTD